MIFNHESPAFQEIWDKNTKRRKRNKYNGAYYYSKEICELMIPRIETDRNWFTVHVQGIMKNHSIVFIHEMFKYERYNDLKDYNDLVLVISHLHQYEHVKDLGKVIWLPMSVDTKYLEQFKAPKTKDVAYIGRSDKLKGLTLPQGIDYICDMPREQLLKEMAKYKQVYAVDRTAIEAMYLGCKVLPFDPRYPDPETTWFVLDSRQAAKMLQLQLCELKWKEAEAQENSSL